jgi:hypothetical protein
MDVGKTPQNMQRQATQVCHPRGDPTALVRGKQPPLLSAVQNCIRCGRLSASIQCVTHRCNERSIHAQRFCLNPATGSACKQQGPAARKTRAHTSKEKTVLYLLLVSFDSKCSKATQEVEGHRYQSNLEYQLAAQHPHHNLRAPTILSIATDFLSTSPPHTTS